MLVGLFRGTNCLNLTNPRLKADNSRPSSQCREKMEGGSNQGTFPGSSVTVPVTLKGALGQALNCWSGRGSSSQLFARFLQRPHLKVIGKTG